MKVHPNSRFKSASQNRWKQIWAIYDVDRNGILTWAEFWKISKSREKFKKNNENAKVTLAGKLRLTIKKAKLTRSTEFWGKMDPLVVIKYGQKSWKTTE